MPHSQDVRHHPHPCTPPAPVLRQGQQLQGSLPPGTTITYWLYLCPSCSNPCHNTSLWCNKGVYPHRCISAVAAHSAASSMGWFLGMAHIAPSPTLARSQGSWAARAGLLQVFRAGCLLPSLWGPLRQVPTEPGCQHVQQELLPRVLSALSGVPPMLTGIPPSPQTLRLCSSAAGSTAGVRNSPDEGWENPIAAGRARRTPQALQALSLSSVTTEPNTRQSDPVNSFSLAQLTNSFSPLPYTQQTRVCSIFFGPERQYFIFAAVYLIFCVSFRMISSVTTLFPSANLKIIRPCPNPVTLTCPVPKHFTGRAHRWASFPLHLQGCKSAGGSYHGVIHARCFPWPEIKELLQTHSASAVQNFSISIFLFCFQK